MTCALLTGCGGGGGTTYTGGSAGAGHVQSDAIRVGDKITVQLTGVPDGGWFNEKQVPASGDIDLPLLNQPFHAVGKTAAELGTEITNAYKSQKIYTNPVITVLHEDRFINVGGEVRGPSNVAYRADSTLMTTINACGGFTEYADRRHVRILRGSQVIVVDAVAAARTPGADPAVYPGDQITVNRTMF